MEGETTKQKESFTKLKSTIIIVGQRDSEAEEVDKGKGTPLLKKKELKERWG